MISSFVTEKSTFVYLWLLVTLVRLTYTQSILNDAQREGLNPSPCREDQFECQSKECIGSELLCDGRADCSDSSDETEFECLKPELACPDYTFRCKYGACIDKELLCDGNNDCSTDGSDEDPLTVCYPNTGQKYEPGMNSPTPPIVGNAGAYDAVVPTRDQPCLVPPGPTNGQFKLRRISDNDDFEYIDPPSFIVDIDSHLIYTCHPGYKIRGNPDVRCLRLGNWSRKPVCIEVRCRPLASESMIGNCIHADGKVKPCTDSDAVSPKTRAEVSCHPGYRKEILTTRTDTVECNEDGKWVPEPIRCIPVCGTLNPDQKLLTPGEIEPNTFPWHASIYVQWNLPDGIESIFRCGATVIRANLLLTAAHCFFGFDTAWHSFFSSNAKTMEILQNFFVVTGTAHHDPDSVLRDFQFIKKHKVRNVHTTCNFHGVNSLHAEDIALVELHEPLEFSRTLLPVCLDDTSSIQQILETDAHRRVTSSFSLTRQSSSTSGIPYSQCATLYNATKNPFYIDIDEFCTSDKNGMDPCSDDLVNDGSGLVYEINDLWYLMGIFRKLDSNNANSNQKTCYKNLNLLYAKVSEYMKWIQQVIYNLERFKYPPCSRYLPPFLTKTTKPGPWSTSTTTSMPTITPTSTTTSTSTTNTVLIEMRSSSDTGESSSCSLPSQPFNGEWKLHRDFCEGDMDCIVFGGTEVKLGSQLVYSCAPGYRLEGNTNVYCRANGRWSSIPVCIENKCRPLNSVSTIAICSRFDQWVDCSSSVPPYTEARVSCRIGYWDQLVSQSEIVECNMDGIWEPGLPVCIPVCGAAFRRSRLFLEGEITAEIYNFPWHATLYLQDNSSKRAKKDIRCSATLIQANLLLTAAHCVYDERMRTTVDPKKLFILMSNIHRHYDSPLHDPHSVRRGSVKNVHVHCKYRGLESNYVADIALLELQERFEFFNMQLHPACLDFSSYNEDILRRGASGAIIGFGKTSKGVPSDVLQKITVPYVSETQCKNSNISAKKQVLISNDKFCAGYNNGTAVCLGEGGGGLFVEINGLWYVMGIVSVDLSGNANTAEGTCDGNTYTLYTKTSNYMAWILDVMFRLERYKSYPPCSRDPSVFPLTGR